MYRHTKQREHRAIEPRRQWLSRRLEQKHQFQTIAGVPLYGRPQAIEVDKALAFGKRQEALEQGGTGVPGSIAAQGRITAGVQAGLGKPIGAKGFTPARALACRSGKHGVGARQQGFMQGQGGRARAGDVQAQAGQRQLIERKPGLGAQAQAQRRMGLAPIVRGQRRQQAGIGQVVGRLDLQRPQGYRRGGAPFTAGGATLTDRIAIQGAPGRQHDAVGQAPLVQVRSHLHHRLGRKRQQGVRLNLLEQVLGKVGEFRFQLQLNARREKAEPLKQALNERVAGTVCAQPQVPRHFGVSLGKLVGTFTQELQFALVQAQ
ncbi:hypothetical protein D3C77_386030 [compost metagenome]